MKGVFLENLNWIEAQGFLDTETVVVIPLGAAAKEHGPHLKLNNDWLIAEYLKQQVAERIDVVVAPTVPYYYYPAFTEYPGSTTLGIETARDLIIDICRSLATHGPHRFYVLNTGISTIQPLQAAAETLRRENIVLRFSNNARILKAVVGEIGEQEGGSHADEIETSMMLCIAPETVDMQQAPNDYHPSSEGGLTRDPAGQGVYSPTGVFGDATLATAPKGEVLVRALVNGIVSDIEALRSSR